MGDKRRFTHISLFAGAGGLDIGLEQAGFKTIWANDIDEDACTTHRSWSDAEVFCGDIGKVDFGSLPDADLISGGFPCQGFSLAGPRKIDDKRNTLYRYCTKILEVKKPKVFLAENVKGLLTMGDGEIIEAIKNDFKSKGYRVNVHLVNASDYGVPQDRLRVFIVCTREDIACKYGTPVMQFVSKRMTLKEAIGDMPEPSECEVCDAPYSSRYMSRNRKRDWNDVSFTITAMAKQVPLWSGSPDMEKLGKDLWKFGEGLTRRMSYKECARIQTFPDNIVFAGDLTSKYRQIGNAVPCELARQVGLGIYDFLSIVTGGIDDER